jgi:4-aminobutyrate aminotransferase-like enzyme/Ser/Thr protein kinase RdoA (MazF antagonist)
MEKFNKGSMEEDFLSIRIQLNQARKIAKTLYQLSGEVLSLPGEIDFNFRIISDSGSFLLKISRPDADSELIEFQRELLEYVARNIAGMDVPLAFPDRNGNYISEIRDESGIIRKVRLLSWIEGRVWSSVNPITNKLLFSLGEKGGKLTKALQGFVHSTANRKFDWDLAQADWTMDYSHMFTGKRREIIQFYQQQYKAIYTGYQHLRKGVVHNDANDNNIIVSNDLHKPQVISIIDFGDAVYTQIINDLAIAIAYGVMNKPDPLSAALPIVEGYHSQFPLLEKELEYLYCLVAMRLIISVIKSAINQQEEPDNEYLLISEKPAWGLLEKWKQISADYAYFSFRRACGYTPHPGETGFTEWAVNNACKLSSIFPSIGKEKVHSLDISVSSRWIGHASELNDLDYYEYKIKKLQDQVPDKIIAGGYLEPRSLYTSSAYDKSGNNGLESRTIHLGIDFWLGAGTPVHALFDGVVITAVHDVGDKEYGGLIILKHQVDNLEFYTLYGHLSIASIETREIGQAIKKADCLGHLGQYPENGNWPTHLHFQIMLSILDYDNDFPGVAYPEELDVWKSICPDPNLIFGIPDLKTRDPEDESDILAYRKEHLGKSLSLSYIEPLHIVRGSGVYLIDRMGRKYLDTVNNVAHVGHEHPRIVKAGQQQMALLNTNTRYLHSEITDFTKELLDTFPDELSVVHVVNSGSEANELALRMTRAFNDQKDMIVVEVGYHGNTGGCIDISSYKFDGRGGSGAPEHTHVVPLPDEYRGIYRGGNTGPLYARHIEEQIDGIQSEGRNVAGFICESIISCGGQIELPEDYLKLAYDAVRNAGGICIADEVQTGCGRVGSKFWGFQLHDVIPDIVTIGKPIGNGHPLAAVICTQEVADAFADGMEYFNTFGGNPVSCAIGREVLSVIMDDKLQENALRIGKYLKSELLELQKDFPVIGDIRGKGLFLGVELCDEHKNPLTHLAAYLVNRMKKLGILMSTDGKDDNVLKIKPPMVFSDDNADQLLAGLRTILNEDFMKQLS